MPGMVCVQMEGGGGEMQNRVSTIHEQLHGCIMML